MPQCREFENADWSCKLTRGLQLIDMGSGSNLRIGANLKSCAAEVRLANEFTLDEQRVLLVDTPGFDDTYKSDTDILKSIVAFLATT